MIKAVFLLRVLWECISALGKIDGQADIITNTMVMNMFRQLKVKLIRLNIIFETYFLTKKS